MASSARIDELRKKFDENPRRYFAPLANEYRKAGDLEQAIFICQEYLPQQPGHMSGHIVYGQALFESGRHDEARGVFETALALDPENLIALHHLGDIARLAGDGADARTWYERVLEADPRNEEVATLLASLPDHRSSQLDYIVPAAAPSDSESLSSRQSESPGAVENEDSTFGNVEIQPIEAHGDDLDREGSPLEPRPAMTDEQQFQASSPLATAPSNEGAKRPPSDDLLDLDDFSLGGQGFAAAAFPTLDVTDEVAQMPESSATVGASVSDASDVASTANSFDISSEEALFEPDPFASADTPPAPPIELASDLNIGLPDDGMAMTSEALTLSDLETFEAGVIATSIPDVAPLETETFFDIAAIEPPVQPPSAEAYTSEEDEIDIAADPQMAPSSDAQAIANSAPIDGGHDGLEVPLSMESAVEEWTGPESAAAELAPAEPVGAEPTNAEAIAAPTYAEPSEAFVTETMAELYIQQGHLESALDIYRKLIEQRPNDPEIQERLRAIEDHMFGRRSSGEPEPEPISERRIESAASVNEPTIREFLTGLLARRAAGVARGTSNGGAGASTTVTEHRTTPGASETITGSIDALFSGAESSAADTDAASALADAFALETSEPAPLQGTPAHRASDELSLDHVFKPNAPRPSAEHDTFSFDQFFADELSESGPKPTGDKSAGAPNPTDDIAQFNAWLNGLKKT